MDMINLSIMSERYKMNMYWNIEKILAKLTLRLYGDYD